MNGPRKMVGAFDGIQLSTRLPRGEEDEFTVEIREDSCRCPETLTERLSSAAKAARVNFS